MPITLPKKNNSNNSENHASRHDPYFCQGKRIFSSLAGAGLYDTIGRHVYLFKRLTVVSAHRFYRFEHIVSYSSGKVVGKVDG